MEKTYGAVIRAVDPESIAAELELEPGDVLVSINQAVPTDFIDYLMLSSAEELELEVLKKSGELLDIEFEKDPDEGLGVTFEDAVFDGIRGCDNHCLFCFVHQMRPKQRPTLYIQDDDYRLSFLQGAYITLTNLQEADWERIIQWHLSPLYISVHATDPQLRRKLLGSKKAGNIMEQLRRLTASGITIHTQAVICPGINDSSILEQTINDLAGLWPEVASLAVVPVGLTGYREKLFSLRSFTPDEAAAVLELVTQFQNKFLAAYDSRFVFAADEWYILSGQEYPADGDYEDYLQLDNGVGLIRRFLTEFHEIISEYHSELSKINMKLVVVTGKAPVRMWQEIQTVFSAKYPGITFDILPVCNQFLGTSVTVTGLLSGGDIRRAIQEHSGGPETLYVVPDITLRQGDALFLDGESVDKLIKTCLPKRVAIVPAQAGNWLKWLVLNR